MKQADKKPKIDKEFSSFLFPLSDEEYGELERSIIEDGCRDPLVLWKGLLIDGHNRHRICTEHGIDYRTVEKQLESRRDVKIWIAKNQLARRNVIPYHRCILALTLAPVMEARAKANQKLSQGRGKKGYHIEGKPFDTGRELAKIAGVSHNTIARVRKIRDQGSRELRDMAASGEVSINEAYKKVRGQERRDEKEQMMREAEEASVTPLNKLGKFSVILADPPWRYEHPSPDRREIENIYPTMPLSEIKELDIEAIALPACILLLWTPNPKMEEAIEVVNAWGFLYRTNFCWSKNQIGQGYYNRQKHELLLVAVKGDMLTPKPANRFDSVIESPREEHSKKPDVVYDMIEKMYPGLRKVELFARRTRQGWSSWGNEVEGD